MGSVSLRSITEMGAVQLRQICGTGTQESVVFRVSELPGSGAPREHRDVRAFAATLSIPMLYPSARTPLTGSPALQRLKRPEVGSVVLVHDIPGLAYLVLGFDGDQHKAVFQPIRAGLGLAGRHPFTYQRGGQVLFCS